MQFGPLGQHFEPVERAIVRALFVASGSAGILSAADQETEHLSGEQERIAFEWRCRVVNPPTWLVFEILAHSSFECVKSACVSDKLGVVVSARAVEQRPTLANQPMLNDARVFYGSQHGQSLLRSTVASPFTRMSC
jgi:hypothetical protein